MLVEDDQIKTQDELARRDAMNHIGWIMTGGNLLVFMGSGISVRTPESIAAGGLFVLSLVMAASLSVINNSREDFIRKYILHENPAEMSEQIEEAV
ncbi:MAG: hypothetical protein Q7R49_02395 [Candidatus Daviesbacteria bacterium]|nr:hypothetical protein [Candidatus Daviesbacteria bacterium]